MSSNAGDDPPRYPITTTYHKKNVAYGLRRVTQHKSSSEATNSTLSYPTIQEVLFIVQEAPFVVRGTSSIVLEMASWPVPPCSCHIFLEPEGLI